MDKQHHKNKSIIEDLVNADGSPMVDMVKQFPVSDPLHLLDQGAMKKMINIWLKGTKMDSKRKWSKQTVESLNKKILEWNRELPSDFNRKMRLLDCLKHWKATEFRLILLYVGIVAFKDILSDLEYSNFLRICLAIRICSCETYIKTNGYKEVAQSLLNGFCTNFAILYGSNEVVSNIHNISHIMEDVNYFGSLTNTSTYPFENYLHEIKLQVHPSNSSIEQISRRMAEMSLDGGNNCVDFVMRKFEKSTWSPILKYKYENNNFKFIQITPNVFLQVRKIGDKWFMTKDNQIVEMHYVTIQNNSHLICGSPIQNKTDFFKSPYSSNKTDIYISDGKCEEKKFYNVNQIKAKLSCLSYENQYVFMPILHSIDEYLEYCC